MVSSLIPFGFLPVISFLLTDIFLGKRTALWTALAVGAGGLGFALATTGFDALGLAHFVLLAALVVASLRTGDDFYFKIHGALMEILSAAILLIAWHGFHRALLLDFISDEMGLDKLAAMDPRLTEDTVAEMLRLLSFQLPWWFLLHALFVFFAAVNWGKWTWALVRVPGFLLMLFLASGFTQGAVVDDLVEGAARVKASKDSAAAAKERAKAKDSATMKAAVPGDTAGTRPPRPDSAQGLVK